MKRFSLTIIFYVVIALVLIYSKGISTFIIDSCNNSLDTLCSSTAVISNPFGF